MKAETFVRGVIGLALCALIASCDRSARLERNALVLSLYENFQNLMKRGDLNGAYRLMAPVYRDSASIDEFKKVTGKLFAGGHGSVPENGIAEVRVSPLSGYIRVRERNAGLLDHYAVRLYVTNVAGHWYMTGIRVQEID